VLNQVDDVACKIVVAENTLERVLDFSVAFSMPAKLGWAFELDWSIGFNPRSRPPWAPELNAHRAAF